MTAVVNLPPPENQQRPEPGMQALHTGRSSPAQDILSYRETTENHTRAGNGNLLFLARK